MINYMSSYVFPDNSKEIPTIADGVSSLVNQLLAARGILDTEEAAEFLAPDYNSQLHDPALLHGIDKAVARIKTAMEKNERIAIFSDYDCDGIPGAVVLHDLFKALKY